MADTLHWLSPTALLLGCSLVTEGGQGEGFDAHIMQLCLPEQWGSGVGGAVEGARLVAFTPVMVEVRVCVCVFGMWFMSYDMNHMSL